jgi:flavin-binding protein dodecin
MPPSRCWSNISYWGKVVNSPIENKGGVIMSVAKVTEIISSSSKSFEHAVEQGVKRASKTLKNIKGAWVKEQQVSVSDGKVTEYRVTLKVTFILNE